MPNTTTREGMTVISHSVKETAAALRKALREAFPGTKFSVTMSRGTGHGWLNIGWTDGPTEAMVKPIADGFNDERFDGMTDSYVRVEPTLYAVPGEDMPVLVQWSCCGTLLTRGLSPEAQAWADAIVAAKYPEASERYTWYEVEAEGIGSDGYVGGETFGTAGLARMVGYQTNLVGREF